MWGPISVAERMKFVISAKRDVKMRFYNRWPFHMSTVWDWTPPSKMTTLVPTERGWSETERMEPSASSPDPHQLRRAVVLESPAQPRLLACDEGWLKNGMSSHSSEWPGGWPAWGGAARLCAALPHTTQASECSMDVLSQTWIIPNPTRKSRSRMNCKRRFAAHPTNAYSLEMWQHSKSAVNRFSNNRRFVAKKYWERYILNQTGFYTMCIKNSLFCP